MTVHCYAPVNGNRMRIHWRPLYVDNGSEVVGDGSVPKELRVPFKAIIIAVQLHDGVISPKAARELERRGFGFQLSQALQGAMQPSPLCAERAAPVEAGAVKLDDQVLAHLMASAGVSPKLRVLYVPTTCRRLNDSPLPPNSLEICHHCFPATRYSWHSLRAHSRTPQALERISIAVHSRAM